MINKDGQDKQKDIDDALSSIDSLLDTASDVEVDDLPVLKLDDETKTDNPETEEQSKTLVAPKDLATKSRKTKSRKINKKTASSVAKTARKTPTIKEPTVVINDEKQQLSEPGNKKPKASDKADHKHMTQSKTKASPYDAKPRQPKSIKKTNSKLNSSSEDTDLSLAHRELPVLDEIISEEEMALIAAGKELPKRVITEKFVPKSTTDKIIDLIAIQLADYSITRLEYEYIHELIDELLEEENSNK